MVDWTKEDVALVYDAGRVIAELRAENARLRTGLDAAIRAATLAMFVIRKQNVMPNSSWESGFESDLAAAKAARHKPETE